MTKKIKFVKIRVENFKGGESMRRLFTLFLIMLTGCGGGHKPPSVETLPPSPPKVEVESFSPGGWWLVTITTPIIPSRIEVIREGEAVFVFYSSREVKIDLQAGRYSVRVIYPDGIWEGELILPPPPR